MTTTEQVNTTNYKISLLKKKNITYLYMYNNYFMIILKIKYPVKFLDKKKISISSNNTNIRNTVSSFIKQFIFWKFIKIKFFGKGFKIKKNSTSNMLLLFNRAHITNIFWKNLFIKKIKKYKMYVYYTNHNLNLINDILKIRYINMFTKKGLRRTRQIILKKKSKK